MFGKKKISSAFIKRHKDLPHHIVVVGKDVSGKNNLYKCSICKDGPDNEPRRIRDGQPHPHVSCRDFFLCAIVYQLYACRSSYGVRPCTMHVPPMQVASIQRIQEGLQPISVNKGVLIWYRRHRLTRLKPLLIPPMVSAL